ncbi:tRNA lysidine(34) synthetase TilS [Elioraea rosea]|uniref:tRNA lysidine(34) synthetase TilS n=1 Tax=Elioraea rosea TaxID=2492390 RepID=UPI001315A19C|nr:tRNA lysidine(34) synthetase TilS [Elioraea rosea]
MSGSGCAAERAAARFAEAMAEAGGWEDAPRLAIALSGGPDSLALALLAGAWARARGGEAIALILDHGVRPAAATEARLAAAWARRHGLAAHIRRLPPGTGPSAARLRAARHAALEAACAEAGALHLLLAHHRSDQAETVLMRALAGTGTAGLGGMAPVRHAGSVRLLRPLLGATPRELKAVLERHRQGWIDDPSNDTAGMRARLRRGMADRDGEGAAVAALAAVAAYRRREEEARAGEVTALLARAASLLPGGGLALDHAILASAPPPLRAAALAAACAGLAGRLTAPRGRTLAAAALKLESEPAFTLGGCVLRRRGPRWRVTAERRRVAAVAEPAGLLYADRARDGSTGGAMPLAAEGLDAVPTAPSLARWIGPAGPDGVPPGGAPLTGRSGNPRPGWGCRVRWP